MTNPHSDSNGADKVFDVVVLGGGPVGENAADRASRTGLSVVLIEDQLVGGECSYWACMPSKALLRPGAALAAARAVGGAAEAVDGGPNVSATLARRDEFASHWDDSDQLEWLESADIAFLRARGRLSAVRTVEVTPPEGDPFTVTARHAVVVTTGSEAVIPPIPGLAEAEPWTSREATSAWEIPAHLAVIGGGVVATEMATAFRDLGAQVTLLVRGDQLLESNEPFVGEAVEASLTAMGVDVRRRTEASKATRDDDGVHLTLTDGSTIVVDEVLVATGRRPATGDLGLDTIGLEAGAALTVSDLLEVAGVSGGWLFAAGDVTDRSATTHQGKYEARVAGDVIAARFGTTTDPDAPKAADESHAKAWSRFRASADHEATTQVVFTRPEVAAVGLTEQAAQDAGYQIRAINFDLGSVAGAALLADGYEGTAQLVLDTDRNVILGATFVGPDVAELLHAATIAVVGQVPLDRLWHAVPAYPTVSEVWLRLLETAGL